MPFIPANGDNYATANSYCSVAYADDFHSLRGNDAWTAYPTDSEKEAALVKASDFIDQKYAGRFIGGMIGTDSLAWPRNYTSYAINAIPDGIKKACAQLALEALTGALSPNIAPGKGALKRKKVDVLESEYFEPASLTMLRPQIDAFMRAYVSGSLLNVPVIRS